MKFSFDRTIIVCVLFSSACVPINCCYSHDSMPDSQSGQSQVVEAESKPTPIPDAGKVIVDEGCNIPPVSSLRIFRSHKTTWNSETGEKVNVVITDYDSPQVFYYEQKPLTHMMNYISFGGTLKLMWLSEMRSGQKVFAYTMFARKKKTEAAQSDNSNGWNDRMFPYTCVDTDGDGRFETVLTTADLLVPSWAA